MVGKLAKAKYKKTDFERYKLQVTVKIAVVETVCVNAEGNFAF